MKKPFQFDKAKWIPFLQIAAICIAAYAALFFILYAGVTPEQYDIQVGSPAPIQILATKDVLDTVTTEKLRSEAAAAVEPIYKSADMTVVGEVAADLSGAFSTLSTIVSDLTPEAATLLEDGELSRISERLSFTLSREQLSLLCRTETAQLNQLFADTVAEVREALESTLPEGQEANAVKSIRNSLSQSYGTELSVVAAEAVRSYIRPTMLIDEEITEQNRETARQTVEPEMCVKGEVIVREGDIVTQAEYAMISSLGLLADNNVDFQLLFGLAFLVLLLMLALIFFLYNFYPQYLKSVRMMTLIQLIVVLTLGCCLALRAVHSYLMPVSLAMLLFIILIDARLGVFMNFFVSLLAALLATDGTTMLTVVLMTALCGPFVAILYAHRMQRTTTLAAGAIIAVCNFVVTLAVGMLNSAELSGVLSNALWAGGAGLLSAVLCIFMQLLFEWMFNLATNSKLIELSNPNQPLLRRLLLEASGTYHHSIIVANLAEAACSAIGANGLLARVGAYYHDVGKLKRPMYFKENQMGDNPHDRTDPRVSTAILTAHPRDGMLMAQRARIPQPVVDIIRQHHGDAPVIYFYDKAQKLYGDQVDISSFRYEGPCPQSREAAVVMLADSVEAATRALPNPDPEKINALIRNIVRGKLNDGQLDGSSLTFNDIERICSAFSTVLTGVFHERIEYPAVDIPPRNEKTAAEPVAQEIPAKEGKNDD